MKRNLLKSILKLCLILSVCFIGAILTQETQVEAAKVKISTTNVKLEVGSTSQLKLTNAKGKVTWKSSNIKVVTVTKKGKITAKGAGEATVSAKFKNKSYTCNVIVIESQAVEYIYGCECDFLILQTGDELQRITFLLCNNKKESIMAKALVQVKIVNDKEEVVYSNRCLIDETWFYNYNGVEKPDYLAQVNVSNASISKGKSDKGTIYLSLYIDKDNSYFEDIKIPVSHLPVA